MTDSFSAGFDGTRIRFEHNLDGAITAAHMAAGSHAGSDFDAIIAGLRSAFPTLRQWAIDAATANTNWPTMTAAQKDSTTRETIRRLGIVIDRVGDLLVALNADA